MKNKKVGVLMGGLSREREISLRTGKAVAQALRTLGCKVVEIDVGRDVPQQLVSHRVEVAFIALHGRYGEDGAIQGLLELMGIPYTGSRILASAIAMDKDLTKQLVQMAGVRVPAWEVVHGSAGPVPGPPPLTASLAQKLAAGDQRGAPVRGHPRQLNHLSLPVIIKPNREGSTIGMTIVRDPKDFGPALDQALNYDETVLVEQYISGREVTVGILQQTDVGATDRSPLLLPILEVVPKGGFYDFKAKYTQGMTEYRVPAILEERIAQEINAATLKVWEVLGLRGVARADFMIDGRGQSWFLEVNTIPGMTATSLVPKAAAAKGISFEQLCQRILESAIL